MGDGKCAEFLVQSRAPICAEIPRNSRGCTGPALPLSATPSRRRSPGGRPTWSRLGLALLLALGIPAAASGADTRPIGTVKVVQGVAFVVRTNQDLPAREGLALLEGDALRTGANGSLGVILRDDTRLSLGPTSELRIDRFLFQPAQGSLGLVLRLVRGAAVYVSGKIAALEPTAVRFETPVGVVGGRGTAFAARIDAD